MLKKVVVQEGGYSIQIANFYQAVAEKAVPLVPLPPHAAAQPGNAPAIGYQALLNDLRYGYTLGHKKRGTGGAGYSFRRSCKAIRR